MHYNKFFSHDDIIPFRLRIKSYRNALWDDEISSFSVSEHRRSAIEDVWWEMGFSILYTDYNVILLFVFVSFIFTDLNLFEGFSNAMIRNWMALQLGVSLFVTDAVKFARRFSMIKMNCQFACPCPCMLCTALCIQCIHESQSIELNYIRFNKIIACHVTQHSDTCVTCECERGTRIWKPRLEYEQEHGHGHCYWNQHHVFIFSTSLFRLWYEDCTQSVHTDRIIQGINAKINAEVTILCRYTIYNMHTV